MSALRSITPITTTTGGIGTSPQRPDGALKVRGEFAYSSDLWADDMLWGATVRSPHPSAAIRSVVRLARAWTTYSRPSGPNIAPSGPLASSANRLTLPSGATR